MKLRNLPNLLLSTSSLFFYLINLCKSAAPADLPAGCPAVSASQRALLDSCCYSTLLPSPWSVADVNMDGITWTAVAGEGICSQNVMVCNASDDWLITQYINTTLGIGLTASEVQVDIIFSCTGDCSSDLDLFYYPIDTEQSQSVVTTLPNNSFIRVGQVSNGSNTVTGITTAGFYLAVQATMTACVTVHQISIILTVCGEDTVNLITFPEAYASITSVTGNCSANSEPSGSEFLTGTCGDNGMWTTSSSCVCSPGHFLENDVCTPCPQNSMTMSMGSTICTCQTNYRRPNSAAANVGCSECVANFFLTGEICTECPENSVSSGGTVSSCTCITDYFLMNGMCVACPYNSNNTQPSSSSCMCKGQSVTERLMNTTTMENCSNCPVDWRAMTSSPLVCEACPDRSERPLNANFDTCTCMTGYKMKSSNSMCLAEVIFPSERSILSEGSAENPAMITMTLSASSYGFSVLFSIGIEDMFRNRISPSNNVVFQVGVTEANIMVRGDDVALSPSFNVTITVEPNNRYIGEGTIEATIEDDDYVGVGFLDPQPVMFNESDDVVSVILRTNVTTAQAIQINVVVSPQDRSVSVLNNPVMLTAGDPTDTRVMLKIQDDVIGGQEDKSITLRLELESPIAFGHLIDLNRRGNDLTDRLTIVIKDDDPPRTSPFALNVTTIIGIAAAAAGLAILIVLILLVCVCICRFNANRQGFYITEEDKTVNPPSMLRYSASLRSISSQAVVPAMDGKGQLAEKENEFYV